ncbi:MAG: biotin--[acetyl-CoA-carboxylase] ligase, partial [Lysobacterales bacterium]
MTVPIESTDGAVRFRSETAAGRTPQAEVGVLAAGPAGPAAAVISAHAPFDALLQAPALPLAELDEELRAQLPALITHLALPWVIQGDQVAWRDGAARAQAVDLDAARVSAALAAAAPVGSTGFAAAAACLVHSSLLVTSTNAVLRACAAAGARPPLALLAHCQSAGRGRRQRAWHGRWREPILMSLLVDTGRPLRELPGLPLVAGLAVAQALVELTGLPPGRQGIGLKWPNDLVHGQGKLGGLLVEAVAGGGSGAGTGDGARAVIGLGLNWLAPKTLQAAAGQPVAALAHLPGLDGRDRAQVAGRVLAHLLAAVARFRLEGLAPVLAQVAAFDVLAGRSVRVVAGAAGPAHGIALGLAADGALRVR